MRVLSSGVSTGLLLSALALGFRHGFDWDHLAAITDISASLESRRKRIVFGTLYATGHAGMVFAIGTAAILTGRYLPSSVDSAMGRVVGVTLLLLGGYIIYALVRYGRDFRMQSRWMLLFGAARRTFVWAREKVRGGPGVEIEHEHDHSAGIHHHHDEERHDPEGTHRHSHRHRIPSDPFLEYGRGTSLAVGMLHGIGAETPTQVVIFVAAAGAGGFSAGVSVLVVFLAGLFAANTLVTLGSALGYFAPSRHYPVYLTLSLVTAAVSIVVGAMFILGLDASLPQLLAG